MENRETHQEKFSAMPTPDENKKTKIMFVTDQRTRDELEALAREDNRTLSNLVETIIKEKLRQNNPDQNRPVTEDGK